MTVMMTITLPARIVEELSIMISFTMKVMIRMFHTVKAVLTESIMPLSKHTTLNQSQYSMAQILCLWELNLKLIKVGMY